MCIVLHVQLNTEPGFAWSIDDDVDFQADKK